MNALPPYGPSAQEWQRQASGVVNYNSIKLKALLPPSDDVSSWATGLKVGDPGLFGYSGHIAQVYKNYGTTTDTAKTLLVVSSAKGDSATYRPIYNAWFEYRDTDDITSLTKNAGYALSLSVAIRETRNNVPIDDVACLTMGNTGGITSAKGTDCVYISENPLYTAAGTDEWYSIFTADCNATVGYQISRRPSSGKVARFPNNCSITFRNAADSADATVIALDASNVLTLGDGTQVARVDVPAPLNCQGSVKMTLGNFANDAAAAAGGVAVGQLYRNGSAVQVRVV